MAKKKATFSIEAILLEQAREIAKENYKSLNNFIEYAIRKAIYLEEQLMYEKEMREASADKMFMKDIEEISRDFAKLDSESLECME